MRTASSSTRRRGATATTGENVTANAKTDRGHSDRRWPATVPDVVEVRGEVYMAHKDFEALNANGWRPMAARCSPTRGTRPPARLRQLKPEITASRPLTVFRLCVGGDELRCRKDTQVGHGRSDAGRVGLPRSIR
jgi:DNA ligase (NAD+)